LGAYDISGYAWRVVVSGTVAYVADISGGLQVIDESNPAIPVRLGSYNTISNVHGVAVSGSLAFVAEGAAGLQIGYSGNLVAGLGQKGEELLE
jgi:hypothetical protein